jgi:HSP20 family protein
MTSQPETSRTVPARPRVLGFPDLRDEMDRLWETLMPSAWGPFRSLARGQLMPALDVFEKDGKLHLHTELPGMTAKDIEIEITDDALTITGEKKDEREVKEEYFYRAERSYGRFRRKIALPIGADTNHVDAHFKDGVLEIEVPIKSAEAATKKIEIDAGA